MNLVVGSTSQLSYYFPEDYVRISSRNIDFNYLRNNKWDSVYICFAEQRIYDPVIDYITPNYLYTLEIINSLLENSNKIVCYGSCELWSELYGTPFLPAKINIETKPSPNLNNEYAVSKLLLWNKIKQLRQIDSSYNKVILIHPFYFNSLHRSPYFLFGKVFDSIINKNKIETGNLNFFRDMVHPKYIVKKSVEATKDEVVGCGKLVNVGYFIRDLYWSLDMDPNEFISVEKSKRPGKEKHIVADINDQYSYDDLFTDTYEELLQIMKLEK